MQESTIEVRGQKLRCLQAGSGPTVLYLHGFGGLTESALLQRLAETHRVLAPEHPGFGPSSIPDWMMGTDDLAFFYLDLLDALDLTDVHLVGHAVGGWIAAEVAIRSTARLASAALLAPAGVVVLDVSITDIFLTNTEDLVRSQVHDPDAPATAAWVQAELAKPIDHVLQNRAALARIGWSPRLHNPQLPYWLHRIDVPTLVVWGEDDQVIPFACHRPYLDTIAGAELMALPKAGHALHVERAGEIADRLQAFHSGARG
ncbi:MAG: alpha/beta fold hydrolase [Rhizobiales bacterium]|nr:alpha/beta fold hydrolase [Hyphomicrobiales bacterium]